MCLLHTHRLAQSIEMMKDRTFSHATVCFFLFIRIETFVIYSYFFALNLWSECFYDYFFLLFVAAEYIIQCRRSDPKLLDCLKGSLHHLRPYLAQGIPAIEVYIFIQYTIHVFILFFGAFVPFAYFLHQSHYCTFPYHGFINRKIKRRFWNEANQIPDKCTLFSGLILISIDQI